MADPIRWTEKGDRRHERPAFMWDEKGDRVPVLDDFGRPVKERVPVTGRVGVVRQKEDIAGTKPMPLPRSIQVLRADGNEVHMPIRSAAASQHGELGTDFSFQFYQLAKAKHEGWILVGSCPVDLVLRRERTKLQMFSNEVRAAVDKGDGCKPGEVGANRPPCRHYIAERDARRALRGKENHDRNEAQKSEGAKQTEAVVALLAAQQAKNDAPSPPPAGKDKATK